ncbi:MAG: DUF4258 domain-containing protein [Chitinivibrionales bacterium]|nr:DUF4258 domain-containing protein [Chitinivibrionales bacterium]
MEIEKILAAIESNKIKITEHADEEAVDDQLTLSEILYSVENGEIIEDYPTDKPYPSCLVFGKNEQKNPIHSVWAYNNANGWAVLITVYRPDPIRWIEWKTRRNKNESF